MTLQQDPSERRKHSMSTNIINPHQRCGYSDSPFARKDTFLYCRVWKWVKGIRTKFMKKESQIIEKGFATFQTRQKRRRMK